MRPVRHLFRSDVGIDVLRRSLLSPLPHAAVPRCSGVRRTNCELVEAVKRRATPPTETS